MCGIAGFYGFKNNNLLKRISDQLKHRGPDGEGFYIDENVSLLNRRLAIIDLKTGDQPIFNENKNIVVVYNGEIYNFNELKEKLKKAGHFFYTSTDTEVIVHGYEEWGLNCFDKFNGMFAIALYDKDKKRLILARDHFGIKPLYYSIFNNKLIFSSEIKPIFYSGLINKEPNDKVIYRYLLYRIHDDTKETFFKNIFRLMPGELLIVDFKKDKLNQKPKIYFQKFTTLENHLSQQKQRILDYNDNYQKKELLDFLLNTVKMRLISDVPVGSCLSGGLDSSTLVVLINQLLIKKYQETKSIGNLQKTFSAIFPKETNNEEHYIDILINSYPLIKNYKVRPNSKEFLNDLEDFILTQEEPTISSGPYAQYKVMQLASQYVKVVLDGQGIDEMLAGYLPYFFVYWKQLWKEKRFFKLLVELIFSYKILLFYLKEFLLNFFNFKKKVLIKKLVNLPNRNNCELTEFKPTTDNLKKRLIQDVFYNSLPALLRYEDKNSMRFSIEGRVPYLDFNFIKFIFSLKESDIIKNGKNKFILRWLMKDLLPDKILNRVDKIGFTTPEKHWFFELKDIFFDVFASESFANRKYFNQKEVLIAFNQFLKGNNDDTMIFWRLFNLEMWLRIFFDEKKHVDENKENIYQPNLGKKLTIRVNDKEYKRYPIKTKVFKRNDDLITLIKEYVHQFIQRFNLKENKFFLVISEKIVAITQGRSYFLWEIKPGLLAKVLSKFVKKTPYGIGLGSEWTMQLAIQEAGFFRIILAVIIAGIGKLFSVSGLFYRVAGSNISTIDGPTEYSVFPSNVSAKLPPKNPQLVAQKIDKSLKKIIGENFLGTVIIDANDLGQNVLGNTTNLPNDLIEKIFSDNPMGQAKEKTPLVMVVFN